MFNRASGILVLALMAVSLSGFSTAYAQGVAGIPEESAAPCPAVCAKASPEATRRAVEEVFGKAAPSGFSAMCGGPITRLKDKGVFLLMANPAQQTMAIVVKVHDLDKSDPLMDSNRTRLAHHLFESYIFMRQGFQAEEVKRAELFTPGGRVDTSRLVVRFRDQFVEPDLIGVVENPKGVKRGKNERLILMLGQPEVGGYNKISSFSTSFHQMEAALKDLLGSAPVERRPQL